MSSESSLIGIIGTILEAQVPPEEVEKGGIHLVQYGGEVAVMYADKVHPSLVNLKPGQQVLKYITENAEGKQAEQIRPYRGEN